MKLSDRRFKISGELGFEGEDRGPTASVPTGPVVSGSSAIETSFSSAHEVPEYISSTTDNVPACSLPDF